MHNTTLTSPSNNIPLSIIVQPRRASNEDAMPSATEVNQTITDQPTSMFDINGSTQNDLNNIMLPALDISHLNSDQTITTQPTTATQPVQIEVAVYGGFTVFFPKKENSDDFYQDLGRFLTTIKLPNAIETDDNIPHERILNSNFNIPYKKAGAVCGIASVGTASFIACATGNPIVGVPLFVTGSTSLLCILAYMSGMERRNVPSANNAATNVESLPPSYKNVVPEIKATDFKDLKSKLQKDLNKHLKESKENNKNDSYIVKIIMGDDKEYIISQNRKKNIEDNIEEVNLPPYNTLENRLSRATILQQNEQEHSRLGNIVSNRGASSTGSTPVYQQQGNNTEYLAL